MSWRAVCPVCPWEGPDRVEGWEAEEDAAAHVREEREAQHPGERALHCVAAMKGLQAAAAPTARGTEGQQP